MTDEERPQQSESEGNGPEAPATGDGDESAAAPADPLEAAKQEAQRLKDQLLRTAADFDNFRKRSRREMIDAEKRAREDLLRDLLPVFDNLERGASHAEKATDVQSLAEGMRLVLRQLGDTLGRMGIERIPSVGRPFDPAVHEAIQHLETTEYEPGIVAAEIQGGYRMADRLIRPALVVVSKGRPEAVPGERGDGAASNGRSEDGQAS